MGEVTIMVPYILLSCNGLGQITFIFPLVLSMHFTGLKCIRGAWLFTSFALFAGKYHTCFTHPAYCFVCCTLADGCIFWNPIVLWLIVIFFQSDEAAAPQGRISRASLNPCRGSPWSRRSGMAARRRKRLNGSRFLDFVVWRPIVVK